MDSIKNMIDVNTIIGDPIQMNNTTAIIPISKVSFGFASGGSEFKGETIDEYNKKDKDEQIQYRLPFGGGAGAGVTIKPIEFLIMQSGQVKLVSVEHQNCLDKILDYVPDFLEKMSKSFDKKLDFQKSEVDKIINHFNQKKKQNNNNNQNSKDNNNQNEKNENKKQNENTTESIEIETEVIKEE